MNYRKLSKKIHSILGLIIGLWAMLICGTGALIALSRIFMKGHSDAWIRFMRWNVALHRWLMFGDRNVGRNVVAILTIIFIIVLLSSLVLVLPRKWKYLANSFKFSFQKGQVLHSLHTVLGLYTLIFLLFFALSGLMWSYPKVSKKIAETINVQHLPPHMKYRTSIDKESNKTVQINLEEKLSPHQKFMMWMRLIHLGKWGYGKAGLIFNFIVCLLAFSYPLTGYLIFYHRKKHRIC